MTEGHEQESRPEVVDLLPTIQNDSLFRTIVARLDAGMQERDDEELQADLNKLRHLLGRKNFNKVTELTALGWRRNDKGEVEQDLTVVDSSQARLWDINIFEDPHYRVMFEVEVLSETMEYESYMVPPSGMLTCQVYPEQVMQIDVATQLSDLADKSYRVIASHEYQTAWSDKRAALLNALCDEVRQQLRKYENDTLQWHVSCREYYRADESEEIIDWKRARQRPDERHEHVSATGRYVNILMPEVAACDLGQLNFPIDFSVSSGAPMIELYDEANRSVSFVSITDVLDVTFADSRDN